MNSLYSNIAYYHGRFQPFHFGHLKVVELALSENEVLVIGISNPLRLPPESYEFMNDDAKKSLLIARDPNNNPWPYWARLLIIRQGLLSYGIDMSRIIFIPNINNTGLPVDEIQFPKWMSTIYICPKDNHNKSRMKHYIENGWKVRNVPLADHNIGSGNIRALIRNKGDWQRYVLPGSIEVINMLLNKGIPKI